MEKNPHNGYISVENLHKVFVERRHKRRKAEDPDVGPDESVVVLDNINLQIDEGEVVCVLGPSGCGKTTMLNIIAGFDAAFSGRVSVGYKEVTGPSSDNIFVFQHSGLLAWMTVWQNVGLGLRHMKDKSQMAEKIQEHIDMVELTGFEHHYPHQLSGGMKRRAELARAMAVSPDVMFMDEPFAGLDFLTHMRMREEILNLHEYMQKTMILVTHDIDDALIMGDRIIIFSERPATVKLARKLDFSRPRDFGKDPELSDLRSEIYLMLGVHHAL